MYFQLICFQAQGLLFHRLPFQDWSLFHTKSRSLTKWNSFAWLSTLNSSRKHCCFLPWHGYLVEWIFEYGIIANLSWWSEFIAGIRRETDIVLVFVSCKRFHRIFLLVMCLSFPVLTRTLQSGK